MKDVIRIAREEAAYPPNLERYLADRTPESLQVMGNPALLEHPKVALFCSRSCPGDLASRTYDVAQHLRDAGATVAGGFHSPMEKECLHILLRSPYPVIIGWGRALEGARISREFDRPLREGRLVLLSSFGPGVDRVTAASAEERNLLIAALAEQVFVAHAKPGSRTERFCRTLLDWGKPLFTLDGDRNGNLLALGAQALLPREIRGIVGG